MKVMSAMGSKASVQSRSAAAELAPQPNALSAVHTVNILAMRCHKFAEPERLLLHPLQALSTTTRIRLVPAAGFCEALHGAAAVAVRLADHRER